VGGGESRFLPDTPALGTRQYPEIGILALLVPFPIRYKPTIADMIEM